MTIAEEGRALRAALQENTATFAARWHRSPRTVEDWEQGRRQPDPLALEGMRALAREDHESPEEETRGAAGDTAASHGSVICLDRAMCGRILAERVAGPESVYSAELHQENAMSACK